MKKLIEREHLSYMYHELQLIKYQCPSSIHERIDNLLKYIDENIVQQDQDSKNELKRVIYKRMVEAKSPEENRQWYDFYKSIDEMYNDVSQPEDISREDT